MNKKMYLIGICIVMLLVSVGYVQSADPYGFKCGTPIEAKYSYVWTSAYQLGPPNPYYTLFNPPLSYPVSYPVYRFDCTTINPNNYGPILLGVQPQVQSYTACDKDLYGNTVVVRVDPIGVCTTTSNYYYHGDDLYSFGCQNGQKETVIDTCIGTTPYCDGGTCTSTDPNCVCSVDERDVCGYDIQSSPIKDYPIDITISHKCDGCNLILAPEYETCGDDVDNNCDESIDDDGYLIDSVTSTSYVDEAYVQNYNTAFSDSDTCDSDVNKYFVCGRYETKICVDYSFRRIEGTTYTGDFRDSNGKIISPYENYVVKRDINCNLCGTELPCSGTEVTLYEDFDRDTFGNPFRPRTICVEFPK